MMLLVVSVECSSLVLVGLQSLGESAGKESLELLELYKLTNPGEYLEKLLQLC